MRKPIRLASLVLGFSLGLMSCNNNKNQFPETPAGRIVSAEFIPYEPLSEKYKSLTLEEIERRIEEAGRLYNQYEVNLKDFIPNEYIYLYNSCLANEEINCPKLMYIDLD